MPDEPEVIEIKPPQVLREQVRREHDAALAPRSPFGGLPIDVDRAQLADLLKPETLRRNADSLPVLAAFQEFLDVERRRTRARMLALTFLFLVVLLTVGGVAGLVGLTYFRRTHEQTQAMQAGLNDLRSQVGAGYGGTVTTLSNLASRASVIETAFDREIAALAIERDGLLVQLSGMNTNLAGLYGTIATLRVENAQFNNRMERRAAEWQMMTSQVDRVMALLTQAPAPAPPVVAVTPPSPGSPSPAVALSPAPPARETLILAIIPKNEARAVEWRIPLPATQE
ncbi:MAG: hypothetical protein QGH42_06805 [Kiritimatiellia bacterium]|jgi:hypothetical protein|nr:hypothetical protein [Kiritimatiellia bacterium]MDP6809390.1 hypothetical protein [Kiritimatiellia bacterium]MDP7023933.1 hypothetical protein [Kiritimatiellia bacterium]